MDVDGAVNGEVLWGKTSFDEVWCAAGGADAQVVFTQYPPNMATWMVNGPFD